MVYKDIIIDLIKKCYDIGLFIANVTSDMGSSNRAMWSAFGIHVSNYGVPVHCIPHPAAPDRKLYFMADVPHVIKNLRSALSKGNFKYGSQTVSAKPIRLLAEYDAAKTFKLAPKLKMSDINPSHFDKMKVASAMHVFSNSVSSGLTFMAANNLVNSAICDETKSTAWFLGLFNRWFDLMSSRSPVNALSKAKIEKYDEAIAFLRDVVHVTQALSIGDGRWKPVQTGIILSTLSVIDLSDEILAYDLEFLLTARLTQDCLENLFSTIRLKSSVPSPIEFRNSLKIVTVAQFLKTATRGSYNVE